MGFCESNSDKVVDVGGEAPKTSFIAHEAMDVDEE